jgi:hypothetical protein
VGFLKWDLIENQNGLKSFFRSLLSMKAKGLKQNPEGGDIFANSKSL